MVRFLERGNLAALTQEPQYKQMGCVKQYQSGANCTCMEALVTLKLLRIAPDSVALPFLSNISTWG